MKNLLFILVIAFCFSCSEVVPQETKVFNDEFITEFINSLDFKKIIANNKHKLSYKNVKNPQFENKSDTVINVLINTNSISYYKAFGNIMLTDAIIKTKEIKFDKSSIYLGVKKQFFLKKFKIQEIHNKLIVSDTEERIKCVFIFKNDVLIEIIYNALIE